MSANYVARELGYGAATEWGTFDDATNAAFEPLETFATRLDDLLAAITGIGFDSVDLWFGHLNWRWATPEHVALAREALARRDVRATAERDCARHRLHRRRGLLRRLPGVRRVDGEATSGVGRRCRNSHPRSIAGMGTALRRGSARSRPPAGR